MTFLYNLLLAWGEMTAQAGDDTKTNGFSIQQAMPATFAEVSLFIKKLKNSKSV